VSLQRRVDNGRTRGNGFKLKEGRFRLVVSGMFFTMRVVMCWNRLPREVVDAPSLEVLRIRLEVTQYSISLLSYFSFFLYNLVYFFFFLIKYLLCEYFQGRESFWGCDFCKGFQIQHVCLLLYLFFSVETSMLKNYSRSVKAEGLQVQLMLFYCILL